MLVLVHGQTAGRQAGKQAGRKEGVNLAACAGRLE
jgi:hypothetical protein